MRRQGRQTIWLGVVAVALLVIGGLAPASAKEKVDSFAGSCSLQGTVTFSPPATNFEQRLHVVYDGPGTCSGTLDGREVSDAPVTVHNVATADGSCNRAKTVGPGHGGITFADGTVISYSFEFDFVGTEGTFSFQGQRSGSAHGHGSFLTQRTPPDVALQCAGDGAPEAPLDISLTTDSPLVSGRGGSAQKHDRSRSR
jgi:hypothetical protein